MNSGEMTEVCLTPNPRAPAADAARAAPPTPVPLAGGALQEAAAAGAGDERPLAEVLAESLIDGAKEDSVVTNPVLLVDTLMDYVNEWRDALGVDAPAAAAPAPAR